jgi:hypothetical protein
MILVHGARLQAIEVLARQLYEESEPGATPWARRECTVREAWLGKAKQILEDSDES